MTTNRNTIYLAVFALLFALGGVPELVAQQPSAPQQQQTQQPSNNGVTVNPAQAPLTPPPSTEEQPTTIYEGTQPSAPAPQTTTVQQNQQQQQPKEPLGAATAGTVATEGGGASRPAGTAIAPAKQHQVRSFLIRLGAVAAAGVAIGTVYALSKGTPSVPPNSGRP
jgi:cobalamin biosynthesis Mg chelatase CobN